MSPWQGSQGTRVLGFHGFLSHRDVSVWVKTLYQDVAERTLRGFPSRRILHDAVDYLGGASRPSFASFPFFSTQPLFIVLLCYLVT